LFFRQFFMTIPDELIEASKLDAAGPFRFFSIRCCRCRAPISRPVRHSLHLRLESVPVAALDHHARRHADDRHGIKKMIVTADALTEWNVVMATAMLAMLPPSPSWC
jgi:sn-glycerol 3-phosphate transport system permease protein